MSDDAVGSAPSIDRALVTKIVSSYVIKNHIAAADVPTLISTVYQSLASLGQAAEPEQPESQQRQSDDP